MANNCKKKIRETLCILLFADFLIHIARGKLKRFTPAIVQIPVRARKIGPKIFYFQGLCRWDPTGIIIDGKKVPPLSWRFWQGLSHYLPTPRKVIFIISILIQSSPYRRQQRIATSWYWYDLNRDPPPSCFCSVCTLIQSGSTLSCLSAQKRFLLLKGPGSFKYFFLIGRNVDELKAYRLIPLTPPSFFVLQYL